MSDFTPDDAFGFLRSFFSHRAYVADGLRIICEALDARVNVHDLSKLADDEFAGYCRINAGVREGAAFGSPEYKALMDRERPTIDAHFSRNRHHPEYFVDHSHMTFIDVTEMVVDWWAARKGYGDPRPWGESFALNLKIKGKYLSQEQVWLAQGVAEVLGDR